jgi:hypothetical protein
MATLVASHRTFTRDSIILTGIVPVWPYVALSLLVVELDEGSILYYHVEGCCSQRHDGRSFRVSDAAISAVGTAFVEQHPGAERYRHG